MSLSLLSCSICGDAAEASNHDVIMMKVGVETGGDHFEKKACSHSFCQDCLRKWVRSKLASMERVIPCPEPECTYTLYPDDVARICTAKEADEFRQRLKGDHSTKTTNSGDGPRKMPRNAHDARCCLFDRKAAVAWSAPVVYSSATTACMRAALASIAVTAQKASTTPPKTVLTGRFVRGVFNGATS